MSINVHTRGVSVRRPNRIIYFELMMMKIMCEMDFPCGWHLKLLSTSWCLGNVGKVVKCCLVYEVFIFEMAYYPWDKQID